MNKNKTEQKATLDDALCYLIGAIDDANDQGKKWRKELVNKCKKNNLKIKFLNPTNKISKLKKEVDEEQLRINSMKKNGRWNELSRFMKKVVRHDHRCIDISDFFICYIDVDCHMCGSYFELQSALSQKKPYFIISKGGKKNIPSWLFGILDHNRIFPCIDDVISNLKKLNEGKLNFDNRWVLIRKEIEQL